MPGFRCASCGEWHGELPLAFHAEAPAYWSEAAAADPDNELSSDQCVIGEHQFIRGLVRLPLVDGDQPFEWGVWVTLSAENFVRAGELWETEGREAEPPMFGWLATELGLYEPSTLNLATMVHTQPVGFRPHIVLDPTDDHPLAVEQREGVTLARVEAIAARLLHG